MALAGMRGRFQVAVAVVPGQQHVFAKQLVGDRGSALDGGVKVECGSG